MKIVLVSLFLNSHLVELSRNLQKNSEFYFIETLDCRGKYEFGREVIESDFVVKYYEPSQKEKCIQLIKESDVVIFGGCPNELIKLRCDTGRLTFIYSERIFKKGTWRRFIPKTRTGINNRFKYKSNKNVYVLCASAYLPYDLSLMGLLNDKYLDWGYFPIVKTYDDVDLILNKKKKNSIVWAGRFVDWKRPDYVVKMAKALKDKGYEFELNIVGDGEMRESLEKMISKLSLTNCVHLLGKKPSDEVREIMEKSEIFLFTSSKYEGWGVVLNEAMNSACAVVASHQIGSAPILIDEGKNGLLFKGGSVKSLTKKVEKLLNSNEEKRLFGKNAYDFITTKYSAEKAGKRLIEFSKAILSGEEITYEDGPMSKAKILKDNWYKK